MNSGTGLRATALLGGGALLLFAALFAGLRWAPEPAPERGFGEPVDAGPLGIIYPALFADSVVRLIYVEDGLPGGEPGTLETFDLWRRLDSNGNVVGGYSARSRGGAVTSASQFAGDVAVRRFVAGEGCTEQQFEGVRPEDRLMGTPVVFFDSTAPGWTATDAPEQPALPSLAPGTEDSRANLRWTLDGTPLSWWAAPDPFVPGATPGQQTVFGVHPDSQLIMVMANRIPPLSSREEARDLMVAFVLVERFDRVPGLQAMREAMDFDELCRED